eukprot:363366-Chlamydomonas_euryale.AAC.9
MHGRAVKHSHEHVEVLAACFSEDNLMHTTQAYPLGVGPLPVTLTLVESLRAVKHEHRSKNIWEPRSCIASGAAASQPCPETGPAPQREALRHLLARCGRNPPDAENPRDRLPRPLAARPQGPLATEKGLPLTEGLREKGPACRSSAPQLSSPRRRHARIPDSELAGFPTGRVAHPPWCQLCAAPGPPRRQNATAVPSPRTVRALDPLSRPAAPFLVRRPTAGKSRDRIGPPRHEPPQHAHAAPIHPTLPLCPAQAPFCLSVQRPTRTSKSAEQSAPAPPGTVRHPLSRRSCPPA